MNEEEKHALHILNKHTILLNIATNNQQTPDRSDASCMEVYNAFKVFNPSYHMDWTCGACVLKMMMKANETRNEINAKFYTFPKQ